MPATACDTVAAPRMTLTGFASPIAGRRRTSRLRADRRYASLKAEAPNTEVAETAAHDFARQAPHAARGLVHPITNKTLRFECLMPGDMATLLEVLRAH